MTEYEFMQAVHKWWISIGAPILPIDAEWWDGTAPENVDPLGWVP